MTKAVRLREEAEIELAAAAEWNELQRSGLGHEFLDQVAAALDAIRSGPFSFPEVHRGARRARRALIKRFPFSIFYLIDTNDIVVIAVMHASRHPMKWQDRT